MVSLSANPSLRPVS